ncbi:hypothetical protein GCM10009853_033850 [Glycomyces scopariae]
MDGGAGVDGAALNLAPRSRGRYRSSDWAGRGGGGRGARRPVERRSRWGGWDPGRGGRGGAP